MTYIEGVHMENPTAVWMQLKNTRHNVLKDKDKWNPGGWYEQHSSRQNPFTMCLANAVRFVARGSVHEPGTYSYDNGDNVLEDAERVILRAIPAVMRSDEYEEIPAFNDASDRKFGQIVKVLDKAIEMVAPYAKDDVITFADDVMTKEELAEIRKATWEAEEAMWDEYRVKWGVKFDKKGKWRTAKGKFAKVPPATRRVATPTMSVFSLAVSEPLSEKEHIDEFKLWLDDHEERGWDTFWDDLLDCDKKDPEYEACQAARKALAVKKPARKPKTKVTA
jgi:hypothetical protein